MLKFRLCNHRRCCTKYPKAPQSGQRQSDGQGHEKTEHALTPGWKLAYRSRLVTARMAGIMTQPPKKKRFRDALAIGRLS